MAIIIKPPTPFAHLLSIPSIFLAGSIAMGQAEPWQASVEAALHDCVGLILNPRRDGGACPAIRGNDLRPLW